MVVKAVSPTSLLTQSRAAFGLPDAENPTIDAPFLAAAIRRAAGHSAPCSHARLRRVVFDALCVFSSISALTLDEVDTAIDDAIVAGDLLELSQVTTEDVDARRTWVFPAPFAFVPLQASRILIMGVVRDQNTPLPSVLSARITFNGPFRSIQCDADEDLPDVLKEMGVLALSESAWLKAPAQASHLELVRQYQDMTDALPPAGEVNGLEVLDWSRRPDRYRDRWSMTTKNLNSYYVARRPQAFGPSLWGFAHFEHGTLSKFLDFPIKGDRWRGCDAAWHLQMAMDCKQKRPQTYRIREAYGSRIIDLFSPIPMWANRRLLSTGALVERKSSLLSFKFAAADLLEIETFLQSRLWLQKTS
ncbi:MAG: hypothetical protein ACK4GK_03350 [Ferrovibrio sp.]